MQAHEHLDHDHVKAVFPNEHDPMRVGMASTVTRASQPEANSERYFLPEFCQLDS